MKKRKVLAMLLAFAMTFSLAACGSSGGNAFAGQPKEKIAPASP